MAGLLAGRLRRAVAAGVIGAALVLSPARGADIQGPNQPIGVPAQVAGTGSPFDPSVRVDLPPMPSRRNQALARMLREIELNMRLTARDMANPDTRFLEGAPGYRELSEEELRRIVTRALKEVPIGELPGGASLARLIRLLPNSGNLRAEDLSYNELVGQLRDRQRRYVEEQLGPYFDEHKVEAGILALAAISGIRAASPDAARIMDSLKLRLEVWSARTDDSRAQLRARLVYRNQEVLPNLDVEARASYPVRGGEVYGRVRAQLSAEAERPVVATATTGLTLGEPSGFVDLSATLEEDRRWRAALLLGHADPHTGLLATTQLSAERALNGRSTRYGLQFDLNSPVQVQGATEGWFGLYLGATGDGDLRHPDLQAGVVFGLRW